MSKKMALRNSGWIQSPFRHSAVIKTALFLCLVALTAGWRNADTLGVAVGIGKQVIPAALDARKATAEKNEKAQKRPQEETELAEMINNDPINVVHYIGKYASVYGEDQASNFLNHIQYAAFSEGLQHIPLFKDEIFSGTSVPYLLYQAGGVFEELKGEELDIEGERLTPSPARPTRDEKGSDDINAVPRHSAFDGSRSN